MRLADSHGPHECGNIIGKDLCGISAFRLVRFACPPQVERDAGKVFGILRYLKCVTGIVGTQIWNQDQRISASLLLIIHGDVVGFDLGHGTLLATLLMRVMNVRTGPLLDCALRPRIVTPVFSPPATPALDNTPCSRHSSVLRRGRSSRNPSRW